MKMHFKKSSKKKRATGIVSLLLAAVIGIWGFMPTSAKAASASTSSTTTDTTIKVAAPNALAVMAEMLGANVVSSAPATLATTAPTMPYFLPTFGVASNNTNADPWLVNYNSGSGTMTNYGWDGYAGSELKPISNATASTLPTTAAALINKPDEVIQFPVGNDTTTKNSDGYYGVDEDGFDNANDAMGNTQALTYRSTNNLPTPADIENTISWIAADFHNIITAEGKTTRYGDPETIANNFNTYYEANMAKAQALTSGLTARNIIHITAYNATTGLYTVIPTSASDIYGSTYITQAGGNNVATGTTMTGSQIASALGSNGVITTINSTLYTDIASDSALSSIPHYMVPTGVYLWSVRSPEGALCSLWLANVLHGNQTVTYNGTSGTVGSFIDMTSLTHDFYADFYHYNTGSDAQTSLDDVVSGILTSGTMPN